MGFPQTVFGGRFKTIWAIFGAFWASQGTGVAGHGHGLSANNHIATSGVDTQIRAPGARFVATFRF